MQHVWPLIHELPDEVLVGIVELLPVDTLKALTLVDRRFARLARPSLLANLSVGRGKEIHAFEAYCSSLPTPSRRLIRSLRVNEVWTDDNQYTSWLIDLASILESLPHLRTLTYVAGKGRLFKNWVPDVLVAVGRLDELEQLHLRRDPSGNSNVAMSAWSIIGSLPSGHRLRVLSLSLLAAPLYAHRPSTTAEHLLLSTDGDPRTRLCPLRLLSPSLGASVRALSISGSALSRLPGDSYLLNKAAPTLEALTVRGVMPLGYLQLACPRLVLFCSQSTEMGEWAGSPTEPMTDVALLRNVRVAVKPYCIRLDEDSFDPAHFPSLRTVYVPMGDEAREGPEQRWMAKCRAMFPRLEVRELEPDDPAVDPLALLDHGKLVDCPSLRLDRP